METVPVHPGEEIVPSEQPPSRRPDGEVRALSGTFPGNLPRLCWPRRAHLHHLGASRELRSRSVQKEEALQGFGWLRGEGPGPCLACLCPEREVPARPTPEHATSLCPAAASPGPGRRGIHVAVKGSAPLLAWLGKCWRGFSFLPSS